MKPGNWTKHIIGLGPVVSSLIAQLPMTSEISSMPSDWPTSFGDVNGGRDEL